MKFLETQRLILRQFEAEDSQILKTIDSDPAVMKYITHGITSDDKEVLRATNVMLGWREKTQGKLGYWIARLKDTSEDIGWFHLRPLHKNPEDFKNLELGYRLMQKYWSHGYTTEVSMALKDYCFNEYGSDVLWAHFMQANKASENVMKKIGMQYDRLDRYEEFPGPDKTCVWYKLVNPNL